MSPHHALPSRQLDVAGLACRRGERQLFEGVSFAVAPGEALLLRGPNGAGKTTLLHALAGIVRPQAGRIALHGGDEEAASRDIHLLGHRGGLKGQLSVEENLGFWTALNGGLRAQIGPALEAVGLHDLARLPAGYLSAGQARRLALARLLCADRPVWLMDEPTAALDSEGEQLVGRLIDAHLLRGGLVVASTHHDLPLAAPARVRTLTLGAHR